MGRDSNVFLAKKLQHCKKNPRRMQNDKHALPFDCKGLAIIMRVQLGSSIHSDLMEDASATIFDAINASNKQGKKGLCVEVEQGESKPILSLIISLPSRR